MHADGVRLTAHQRIWLNQIRACETSEMTKSAYAAEHGLGARTLYGAKKVLKRKGMLPGGDEPVQFQRARVVLADGHDMRLRIALPNGMTVSFSGGADSGSLSLVLNTVTTIG